MEAPQPIRKTGPIKICHDCDPELYPRGKIISSEDILAKQDRNGKWHCSDCQLTDKRKDLIRIYGPNHTNTRYFLEHEDKQIRAWNKAVKEFGIGAGPYRKNKYTGEVK